VSVTAGSVVAAMALSTGVSSSVCIATHRDVK
jgi:hypothetical protein